MQPVTLTGIVTRFKGNGRKLGYPTANLTVKTTVADGVYFGFADLAAYSRHPSLIFIGVPGTVGDIEHRVEIHLLDIPDVDYYDQQLSVTLQHYYRANETFANVSRLLRAIQADDVAARQWFSQHSSSDRI